MQGVHAYSPRRVGLERVCRQSFDWRVSNELAKCNHSQISNLMSSNIRKPLDMDYVKSIVRDSKYENAGLSFRVKNSEKEVQPPMKYSFIKKNSKLDLNESVSSLYNTEALSEEAKGHEFRDRSNPK